jgi:hypothetical protein
VNQSLVSNKHFLRESLKQQELSAYADYRHMLDADEQKRQQEKHEREERIKRLINRVPQVTVEGHQQQQV